MAGEAQHALNALQLAVDEINASEQLGNTHLSLVTADDTLTATGAQAALQSLLEFNRMDAEALNTFTDKRGVTLVKTPDDILVAHLKSWDKIAARESAKDPFFKKVLDSQRAYAELVVPARLFMSPYDTIADYYWGDKEP